jgi:tryptophan 2-monooxygenase
MPSVRGGGVVRNLFRSNNPPPITLNTVRKLDEKLSTATNGPMPKFLDSPDQNTGGTWVAVAGGNGGDLHQQLWLNLLILRFRPDKKDETAVRTRNEIIQVWDYLSDSDKVKVLKTIAKNVNDLLPSESTLSNGATSYKGPAMSCLRRILKAPGELERLSRFINDEKTKKMLKEIVNNNSRNNAPIDTLYNHHNFLKAHLRIGTLGNLPPDAAPKEVAIVGGGLAGISAAYELQKLQGVQITIFEASARLGGRLWSEDFSTNGQTANEEKNTDGKGGEGFVEKGAMRFSKTGSKTLFHYLKTLGIDAEHSFPNPGTVPTLLDFRNKKTMWFPGEDKLGDPQMNKVKSDYAKVDKHLVGKFRNAREKGDTTTMRELWCKNIKEKKYGTKTFREGLETALNECKIKWSEEDFAAFGTLGVGTGGFGPLYPHQFLDVLRIMVDEREDNQRMILGGAGSIIDKLHGAEVEQEDGTKVSLKNNATVLYGTKVIDVGERNGKPTLTTKSASGSPQSHEFDAVIIAAPPKAMQMMQALKTSSNGDSGAPFDADVANSVSQLNMMQASKLYIRTPTKFWQKNEKLPRVFLTDRPMHQLYCMEYPDTNKGVILASYPWGSKAGKLSGTSTKDLVRTIFNDIREMSPEFAKALEEDIGGNPSDLPDGDVRWIDWLLHEDYGGAFKLNKPGDERYVRDVYYAFQDAGTKKCSGTFLANDWYTHSGGWANGASMSGINAAVGVVKHLGGTVGAGSPLEMNRNLY